MYKTIFAIRDNPTTNTAISAATDGPRRKMQLLTKADKKLQLLD